MFTFADYLNGIDDHHSLMWFLIITPKINPKFIFWLVIKVGFHRLFFAICISQSSSVKINLSIRGISILCLNWTISKVKKGPAKTTKLCAKDTLGVSYKAVSNKRSATAFMLVRLGIDPNVGKIPTSLLHRSFISNQLQGRVNTKTYISIYANRFLYT